MVIAQYSPFQPWLPWNSDLIIDGQWWRIVTGNFTHTNLNHLMLNAASFAVLIFFFRQSVSWLSLFILTLLSSTFIGIGLLASDMYQYVGFSGVLHGIFGFYAITETIQGRKYSSLLILGILIKIGWELWLGPSPSTELMIEAKVATEAHFAGAVIGLILGSLQPRSWMKE